MFLPIGDTPNPRNYVPYVNWALIAANVVVYLLFNLPMSMQPVDPADPAFREYLRVIAPSLPPLTTLEQVLAQISAYDLFVFAHGYKPGAPEFFDLFSSMFLHGGILHLAGNMLFLWIFGDNVEHRLGRLGYLITYLVTGAVATLAFSALAGDSMLPLVGASGAISGVLGLYFLLFPRNQVKVFIFLFPFILDVWLLPVRWVLAFYVLVDNLLPFLLGSQSNVAYGAHLGGFLAGLGAAWAGERLSWRWPWRERSYRLGRSAARVEAVDPQADPLGRLRGVLASGDHRAALAALSRLSRSELASLSPEECATLATWLHTAGHSVAASNLLRQCLAARPGSENLSPVYLNLGLIRLAQGQPTAAYQHLLSVFDHEPDAETAARAREALSRIDVYRRRR